jgi:signal transduction histidine kinase
VSEDDTGATVAATPATDLTPLTQARLDELLAEVLTRVTGVLDAQERLRGLLDAVIGINADLSLERSLERIVTAACTLAGAEFGALGVLGGGPGRRLREFVTHGLPTEQRNAIGDLPAGHGILGVLIDRPEPLRLPVLGQHPSSYGFPPHHPPMQTFLGVPIRIRDQVFGNLYLTEKKGGGSFTSEDEEVVVALAAAAGVVIENARLFEDTTLRRRWLEAAAEVSSALLTDTGGSEALALVAERARDVPGADTAAVLVPADDGRLQVVAVAGLPEDDLLGTHLDTAGSHLDDVAGAAAAIVLPDVTDDPRAPLELLGDPDGSLVLVPLRTSAARYGVLVVGWEPSAVQAFLDTDVRLIEAYADQTALAMQVAQAREDRSRLAVFEDRDRIGRDLHDLVIQRLFAIGLTLENAGRLAERPEVSTRLSTAVDDIDATIKDIRRTIFELSAPPQSQDVRAQLAEALAVVAPALGFSPHLSTVGPVHAAIGDEVRGHLLAVLREALSNAARHAAASQVDVVLTVDDEVVLTVRDDGVGYQPGERRSGVGNMAERAAALGGTCSVVTRDRGGTEVVWRVPTGGR